MIIQADDNQELKEQLLKQAEGVVATARKGFGLRRSPSNQGQIM